MPPLSNAEVRKRYYQRHPDRVKAAAKAYRAKPISKLIRQRWDKAHPERKRVYVRAYQYRLRYAVLSFYGGIPPKCACCGESEMKFLGIDHINGRNGCRKTGHRLYYHLRKNGFPAGFQVLCHNCNLAKGFYGRCPHKD